MAKKIVDFGEYCKRCKYYENAENEDPCWDCLTISVNDDTHRPVEFVKAEEDSPKN